MALTFGFYDSLNHDRLYNAQQMSAIFDGIINDGVFASVGSHFSVVPGTGMHVLVKSGRAWFNSTWTLNDSDIDLTIDAADSLLGRIDTVVLEVNSEQATRANSIKVVKGTAASTPAKPTLTNTTTVHQHPLAHITVAKNTTAITASMIEIVVGKTDCPFVTAILQTTDITNLFEKWENDFQTWFSTVRSTLDGDVALNLQNQIDANWRNTLKDATKTKLGLASDAVPDDAFNALTTMASDELGSIKISKKRSLGEKWQICNGTAIKSGSDYEQKLITDSDPYDSLVSTTNPVDYVFASNATIGAEDYPVGTSDESTNAVGWFAMDESTGWIYKTNVTCNYRVYKRNSNNYARRFHEITYSAMYSEDGGLSWTQLGSRTFTFSELFPEQTEADYYNDKTPSSTNPTRMARCACDGYYVIIDDYVRFIYFMPDGTVAHISGDESYSDGVAYYVYWIRMRRASASKMFIFWGLSTGGGNNSVQYVQRRELSIPSHNFSNKYDCASNSGSGNYEFDVICNAAAVALYDAPSEQYFFIHYDQQTYYISVISKSDMEVNDRTSTNDASTVTQYKVYTQTSEATLIYTSDGWCIGYVVSDTPSFKFGLISTMITNASNTVLGAGRNAACHICDLVKNIDTGKYYLFGNASLTDSNGYASLSYNTFSVEFDTLPSYNSLLTYTSPETKIDRYSDITVIGTIIGASRNTHVCKNNYLLDYVNTNASSAPAKAGNVYKSMFVTPTIDEIVNANMFIKINS